MKIRNLLFLLVGFCSYFFLQYALVSYDHLKSHKSFNRHIVDKFEKHFKWGTNDEKFKNYQFIFTDNSAIGLGDKHKIVGPALTNSGYFHSTVENTDVAMLPIEWIEHGGFSADEPQIPAATRHFYDPVKLSGHHYLTNRGTYWEGIYPNPGIDAIEWALGDTENGKGNPYNLDMGKTYMILGLIEKDSVKRNLYFAKAYRCLGEVLHNTADMGLPSHVRNDSHAAPVGLTLGKLSNFGSPDPHEELFGPYLVERFKDDNPDPNLSATFSNASKIRTINTALATFTNENFFTHETINGMQKFSDGTSKTIEPYNGKDGKYPKPRLENLDYESYNYSYSKKFPSGRTVILARDRWYFSYGQGYPHVDKVSAVSQSSELVPNILHAGINVMRLFFPHLEIEMNNVDDLSDTVTIDVKHIQDSEYTDEIWYYGPVRFMVNGKLHDSILVINHGEFKGVLPFQVKNGDKIKPFLDLPGFMINAEKETIIKMNPLWGIWYIREVLDSSNDPAAPAKGTVFTGIKFYKVLSNGMVRITNLDGSQLMQLKLENTGLHFLITGNSSTQSYYQAGDLNSNQETWSAYTVSEYRQGDVYYNRKYNTNGSRKPIGSKVNHNLDSDEILDFSQFSGK
ncbi:MAG: hypothetical protein KIT33_02245 [Candidatus Kapabacteria bacterium]|nr:hypothetical protein [Ignavibacteriota bacterium]MCW5883770.1 hypothetical protein [Candidatus Kapabacteria bacterium]